MASANKNSMYHCCEPVIDTEYDTDCRDSITSALVDAIATAEGIEPTELDPLYGSVDLDALERLVHSSAESDASNGVFSFSYETWNVFVSSDGRIRVCDGNQPVEPMPVFGGSSR